MNCWKLLLSRCAVCGLYNLGRYPGIWHLAMCSHHLWIISLLFCLPNLLQVPLVSRHCPGTSQGAAPGNCGSWLSAMRGPYMEVLVMPGWQKTEQPTQPPLLPLLPSKHAVFVYLNSFLSCIFNVFQWHKFATGDFLCFSGDFPTIFIPESMAVDQ
jgi:hypothetical protein